MSEQYFEFKLLSPEIQYGQLFKPEDPFAGERKDSKESLKCF